MKIRRTLLTILSLLLILCGCLYTPNKSKASNEYMYDSTIYRTIYIDEAFSISEEEDIERALESWENASSNKIKFNINFKTYEPGVLDDYFLRKSYKNSIFIWRENTYLLSWYLEPKLNMYSGIYDRLGNVIIFPDKIDNLSTMFVNVVRHELGHALGLEHSNSRHKSTMHPKSNDISDCISSEDAERLCSIYLCIPNPECN